MRNLLTIHLPDTSQNSVLNAANSNEIILLIHPLSNQETGYKVTALLPNGTSAESDELTIENGEIRFDIPYSWFSSAGTLRIRLESNEGNSDYISFTVSDNLAQTDDFLVKLITEIFVISKNNEDVDESGEDYNHLKNKPSINAVTLIGNKTGTQLSLINTDDTMDEATIDTIVYGGLGNG